MIIPVYDIDRLVRLARQQLRADGLPVDSLAVYALVARLRAGELRDASTTRSTSTLVSDKDSHHEPTIDRPTTVIAPSPATRQP